MAAGFTGDFRQANFVEQFTDRGHLGDEALLHESAFLAAGVRVELVIEADGCELLLAEPGLKRHVESDVDGGAVTGKNDDVLYAPGESDGQGPFQA